MDEKKLNVCLLNDSFPPVIDGVANAVINYANIIQNKFGNAIVATPNYPNITDDYTFPVLRYPSLNTMRLVGYRMGYPFSVSAMQKLKENDIDIIHTHCPVMSAFFARTLRECVDAPIVLTYHSKFDIDIAKAVSSEFLQQKAIKFILNNIEACDEVWVVSNGAGENLRGLGYTGDYIVMENGVDFAKGRVPEQLVGELRNKHDCPAYVPVFLFVGRLMWYKGIRLVLDSLKKLKDSGQFFKMIFVGDGADRPEIESYKKQLGLDSECIFTGPINDREKLRTYYCLADLLLFPSTYDTNGLVVREAAACGLPSILLSGSSAAEGITDGHTGILVDDDSEDMPKTLAAACGNKVRLKEIGQNAMDEIYISWEDSVTKAYNRYGAVLENYERGINRRQAIKHDEFFTTMADICDGLEKARTVRIGRRS